MSKVGHDSRLQTLKCREEFRYETCDRYDRPSRATLLARGGSDRPSVLLLQRLKSSTILFDQFRLQPGGCRLSAGKFCQSAHANPSRRHNITLRSIQDTNQILSNQLSIYVGRVPAQERENGDHAYGNPTSAGIQFVAIEMKN